jgi:peroxiredoxin
VTVIGLGTQDSLGQANEFRDQHDITFPILWDESFVSWQVIGVTSQPTAVMIQPDGSPITGWIGPFPEDEVLDLAAQYAA